MAHGKRSVTWHVGSFLFPQQMFWIHLDGRIMGLRRLPSVSCVYIPTFEPGSIGIGSRLCRRTNSRMYLDMPSSCYNRLHFDFTKRLISIEFFSKCSLCYAQDMQNSMHFTRTRDGRPFLHRIGSLIREWLGKNSALAVISAWELIHPWSLTRNLKINPWKRRFHLETIIFHVKRWVYISLFQNTLEDHFPFPKVR